MKQLIVMIAMIMLGIAIAGLIASFGVSAGSMTDTAQSKLSVVTQDVAVKQ